MNVHIAILQYHPQFKQVQQNMSLIKKLVHRIETDLVDILLLPEMAFTGYCFSSVEDIDSYCEVCGDTTNENSYFSFLSAIAQRLQCIVLCGYPEKFYDSNNTIQYYNSQYIIDHNGKLLHNYRKYFLYETDKKWCSEGSSFLSFKTELIKHNRSIQIGTGICMDINPKDFVAPWDEYEFATFHKQNKSQLLLLSANWLDRSDGSEDSSLEKQTYWLNRLKPFVTSEHDNCYFAISNRVGSDGDVLFCGASCVMALGQKPRLHLSFDNKEQGIKMARINLITN
jgi:protein N-terminal amidase